MDESDSTGPICVFWSRRYSQLCVRSRRGRGALPSGCWTNARACRVLRCRSGAIKGVCKRNGRSLTSPSTGETVARLGWVYQCSFNGNRAALVCATGSFDKSASPCPDDHESLPWCTIPSNVSRLLPHWVSGRSETHCGLLSARRTAMTQWKQALVRVSRQEISVRDFLVVSLVIYLVALSVGFLFLGSNSLFDGTTAFLGLALGVVVPDGLSHF